MPTEAQIEDFIQAAARDTGISTPPITWVNGPRSSVGPRGDIRLRRSSLEREDDAHFCSMHELAHVVLGHTRLLRRARDTALFALPLVLAYRVILPGILLLGLSLPLTLLLGCLLFLAGLHLGGRLGFRPAETAADSWAAQHGGPLTLELAQTLAQRRSPLTRALGAIIGSHAAWPTRASLTRKAGVR